ncbi:PDC sensor domain-containing protein [Vreelandella lionensis]|uniref:PDC sensor domain-containing protein n=1 Tax=Vreelandella lionensis TaxID=1144478 RepID=UPI0009F5D80A|nr:hypothetical protein [Halomonas lionensis]
MRSSRSDELAHKTQAVPMYRRQQRQAIVIFALALCVMLLLFGWLLEGQYQQEIRSAESRAISRSNVVAEWAKGMLGQSGQALFTLAERVESVGGTGLNNTASIQYALESLAGYMPLIDELGVLNAQGRVWVSSSNNRHAGLDISETDFFRSFQQGKQQELVTPLYWSSQNQQFYLYHARRLNDASGNFNGLVLLGWCRRP